MKQSFEIVFISPSSNSERVDLYSDLKKLHGVVPKRENNTTSIVFDDEKLKDKILKIAQKHGVAVKSIKKISRNKAKDALYDYEKTLHVPRSINEESANTLQGSLSDEQILSRLWMAKKLKDVAGPIKSCIILGSWYGLLPYILSRNNKIKTIFAVDTDPYCIALSKKLNPNVNHVCSDCNELYLGTDCIINPSVNNISNRSWFNDLNKDKLCLLQTESIAVDKGCPGSLEAMKDMYPLRKVLYEGILECTDKDGTFVRSMLIGKK